MQHNGGRVHYVMAYYPNFNGSHFGLPPKSIHKRGRIDGLGGTMVWTMMYMHGPHLVRTRNPALALESRQSGVHWLLSARSLQFLAVSCSFFTKPYRSIIYAMIWRTHWEGVGVSWKGVPEGKGRGWPRKVTEIIYTLWLGQWTLSPKFSH